jgi:hypothetical protein
MAIGLQYTNKMPEYQAFSISILAIIASGLKKFSYSLRFCKYFFPMFRHSFPTIADRVFIHQLVIQQFRFETSPYLLMTFADIC